MRRKPTIFDAVSRLVPPPRHVCERQELLASDAVTLASRYSVTAGESCDSCDGSSVAGVCDIA